LLGASYHPGDGWGLDKVRAFRCRSAGRWLLDHGTPTLAEDFKSIAGVCAVALGAPNTDSAWVDWLDCLRRESPDFKPAEFTMDSRSSESRPEPDFEVTVKGLLYPPVEIRPGSDAEIVTTELGQIDDVCATSERVCRRLADEALKTELNPAGGLKSPQGTSPEVSPAGWTITQPWESEFVPGALAARPSQVVVQGPGVAESKTTKAHDASRAMTLKEAARALRVSSDTLHRMRKRGAIEMFTVGSRWRVLASEVIRIRQKVRT